MHDIPHLKAAQKTLAARSENNAISARRPFPSEFYTDRRTPMLK